MDTLGVSQLGGNNTRGLYSSHEDVRTQRVWAHSEARLARAAAVRLARERVTQLYFQRVEVLVRMRLEPNLELVLEAARLDGLLDALTGGRLRARERSE